MFARRNGSRLRLNETPKNFIIKRNCSTNKSSQLSSLNSTHSTKFIFDETEKNHPEDGKLLNLLSENENDKQSHIFQLQMNSFHINDESIQQRYAISDDINNPQLLRNITYNWHYHFDHQQHLNQDTLSFSFSIKKHGIKELLRAKMIDWIIEVFGNYSTTTTAQTYFRAVGLMDAFLKKTTLYFQDNDVHLIGICCMFIASKLEDIYHIPLSDFVNRVGHNKFTAFKIKTMEQTILQTLQFNIYFPTSLDHLQHLFYRCFNLNDNEILQNIYDTCVYILKMCMHDLKMLTYSQNALAAAILGYSTKEYIDTKQHINKAENFRLNKQSQDSIIQIAKVDINSYNEIQKSVCDLINSFKLRYPDLLNLSKFS